MIEDKAIYFIREIQSNHQPVDVKKLSPDASAADFLRIQQAMSANHKGIELRVVSGSCLNELFRWASEAAEIT